ncbi:MAG TPA: hypothetical protein VJN70_00170 [Gemmatimonadaceae bacterium]|nr:hypothetical protein [Gemmatimonadaceae bacterium]
MFAGRRIRDLSLFVWLIACAALSGVVGAQQPTVATARVKTLPVKDPQLATILGVIIPGGGQLYTARYGKGLALLLGSAAGVAIAVDANHSRCTVGKTCNRGAVEAVGIGSAAVLWAFGWATAAHDARLFNTQRLNRTSFAPFLDRREGRLLAGLELKTH